MKNNSTDIILTINNCSKCPKHRVERTPQTGYAIDYYCEITNHKVASYIEWPSEIPPVPDNCPLKKDNTFTTIGVDEYPNVVSDGMFAVYYCEKCKSRLSNGKYCPSCGRKVIRYRPMTKEESWEYRHDTNY